MSKVPLSPRLTRGRKRTGLINQLFIGSVLMRSRVKRGNKAVLTQPPEVHRGRGSASKLQNRSLKRNGKREPTAEGLL
ncbi:hypothetical protein DWU89_20435 [Parabacteroides acidifaciens]|uniref:Uncharacterized protein n=1 Tax=Parabacteroides acidifaciens TaxID=2290935 RepID=A0A3D8H9R7_9BACT|nr:hypothetical protein DWU89_20435 [Parabacteroides acidifaciens]